MYEINGSDRVEKIKGQLLRLHVTANDLAYSINVINYLVPRLNSGDDMLIESLTTNAVISYTRCFNSEFSYPLSADIFDSAVPSENTVGQISERQFHHLIMNYRNKHIAHSDDFLKAMVVGGARSADSYAVLMMVASRQLKEAADFYTNIERLALKAQSVIESRKRGLQNKLLELLQSGEAILSDETARVTPIPLEISVQELWGLKET